MNTIVIYFTGLLLFVPDSRTGQMHVVAPPSPGAGPPHVMQIGLRTNANTDCDFFESRTGYCYFNMAGWSLDLFPDRTTENLTLPLGAVNLSQYHGPKMDPDHLSLLPGSAVRSRISLGAGKMTHHCELAEWFWQPVGRIHMTNVIEWSVGRYPSDELRLTLTRLNRRWYEVWETRYRELPVVRASAGMFPIIVRQVDPAAPPGGPPVETATHFEEYYRLLRIPRPWYLPERDDRIHGKGGPCRPPRAVADTLLVEAIRSATTYSCMVASGLPQ